MFQYFHQRRPSSSAATLDSHSLVPSSTNGSYHSESNFDSHDNQLASSSLILVYPSPPSEQESSSIRVGFGSSESTLSLPTDVSLESVRSPSRRPNGEGVSNSNENWPKMLPTLTQDHGWDESHLGERSEWALSSAYSRPESMSLTSHPPRTSHIRTTSSLSSPFTLPLSTSPQPPFRLPFISFLLSFLTTDESTLHLISRSPDPHMSSLFPVSPGPHSDLEDDEEPPHGALKLLLSNPDKSQNTALLKAGIDPSEMSGDTNMLLVSPTRLPVWPLLKVVVEGGVMAWKEVKAWNAGDARFIGV
ncbi:hypothetical protein JB92DRAFT_2962693 [Gautieria morchelliformis]|nr:hypothetical protein JB92DRAFT_2962693 [Gautieria morchelliformis]